MKAKSVISVLIFLAACFTTIGTQGQQTVNLTGRWSGNDGGTYYLRQLGNELWWSGQSGDGGQSWSNVYQGAIRGDQISGRWADVPQGRIQSSGVMDLVINNPNQLTATHRTGGFGGSVWTRQGVVAVAPPPPAVSPPGGASAVRYIGCFKDQGDPTGTGGRDLSGAVRQDGGMSTQMCASECRAKGFAYAGTQYGTWCFCGNSYGKSGAANNCDMACGGSPGEKCGGAWANSVYQVADAAQPPPTRPSQPTGAAVRLDAMATLQIIRSVPSQNSAAFKGNLRTDLAMQTSSWDKTPYTMYEGTYNLILSSPRKVTLSGNAQGSEGWSVDNFLLLEIMGSGGRVLKRVVIGNHEPVLAGGVPIEKWGENKFAFAAGEIDISKLLPLNEPFTLRASAVDYGGVGATSNVFLTVGSGGAVPPQAAGVIQVIAGTYGANCGQPRGNKTAHLASACNGRDSCEYTVNHQVIGDPAVGCAKTYTAEWQCGGRPMQVSAAAEAGFGSRIMLSCKN